MAVRPSSAINLPEFHRKRRRRGATLCRPGGSVSSRAPIEIRAIAHRSEATIDGSTKRGSPGGVDESSRAAAILSRIKALPPDILVLTLACVAFVGIAGLISRAIGAPFVMPRGESPALGTNFSVPLVAAVVGYAVLQIGARATTARRPEGEPWSRRALIDLYLLALFTLVIYVHFHIKMWIPLINSRNFDATFFAIDNRFRFVIEGLRGVRSAIAVAIPAPDIWYEAAFFSMFSLAFWFHAASRRRWHYHNIVAITLLEMVGPFLYLVTPSVGPFLFEHGDNARATAVQQRMYDEFHALRDGGAGWLEQHGGEYFTAPLAAMPSLHFAVTFVLAYYAVRARLVIAPIVVLAVSWIAIESIVSRWHYLVDLPAGLLLAMAVIALTNRLCRFRLATDPAGTVSDAAASGAWVLAPAERRRR